jgi:hypothetical protein
VIVARWNLLDVWKANVPLVYPAGTVIDLVIVTLEEEAPRATTKPPAGAEPESETVQVPDAPADTDCGVQARPFSDADTDGGVSEKAKDLLAPPRVALMVAV